MTHWSFSADASPVQPTITVCQNQLGKFELFISPEVRMRLGKVRGLPKETVETRVLLGNNAAIIMGDEWKKAQSCTFRFTFPASADRHVKAIKFKICDYIVQRQSVERYLSGGCSLRIQAGRLKIEDSAGKNMLFIDCAEERVVFEYY